MRIRHLLAALTATAILTTTAFAEELRDSHI
jgi:hypothetical protein